MTTIKTVVGDAPMLLTREEAISRKKGAEREYPVAFLSPRIPLMLVNLKVANYPYRITAFMN